MTKPAVEFEVVDDKFCLVYRPSDGTSWVHERFARGDELLVKGTFHLTSRDLLEDAAEEADNAASDDEDFVRIDDDRLVFAVATAEADYFRFKPDILSFDTPVLLHRDTDLTGNGSAQSARCPSSASSRALALNASSSADLSQMLSRSVSMNDC
jgi:hypothetical protein